MNNQAHDATRSQADLRPVIWYILFSLIYVAHCVYLWDFGIDDAGISYRFAKHLASGFGLRWNTFSPPIEGYSNFLWVLILAGAGKLGLEIETAARSIGLGIGLVNLWLVVLLSYRVWHHRRFWWAPGLLIVLVPEWAAWSVSGLEIASFGLFILLMILGLTETGTRRNLLLSVGACGLALTRPEGPLLAGIILLLGVFYSEEGSFVGGVRRYLLPLAVLALTVIGFLSFRLWYFGTLLANTVHAKFELSMPSKWRILEWLFFSLPFLVAWVVALKDRQAPNRRLALITCVALLVAQVVIVLPVNPVMYLAHRYQIALLPLLVFPMPILLDKLAERSRRLAPVALIVCVAWCFQGWPTVYRHLQVERMTRRLQSQVVEFLRGLPGVPSVALGDSGRIPYWSDLPSYDVWGLCDATIARKGFTVQRALSHDTQVYLMSMEIDSIGRAIPFFGFDVMVFKTEQFQQLYDVAVFFERTEEEKAAGMGYDYVAFVRKDWGKKNGIFPDR